MQKTVHEIVQMYFVLNHTGDSCFPSCCTSTLLFSVWKY